MATMVTRDIGDGDGVEDDDHDDDDGDYDDDDVDYGVGKRGGDDNEDVDDDDDSDNDEDSYETTMITVARRTIASRHLCRVVACKQRASHEGDPTRSLTSFVP